MPRHLVSRLVLNLSLVLVFALPQVQIFGKPCPHSAASSEIFSGDDAVANVPINLEPRTNIQDNQDGDNDQDNSFDLTFLKGSGFLN